MPSAESSLYVKNCTGGVANATLSQQKIRNSEEKRHKKKNTNVTAALAAGTASATTGVSIALVSAAAITAAAALLFSFFAGGGLTFNSVFKVNMKKIYLPVIKHIEPKKKM